jgi:2-keto-4-pentenoate hydratase
VLDAATLDAIASEVRDLRDEVRQATPITGRYPGFGLDDAYAVAARLHQHRVQSGAVPRGRKIGFTNSGIWPEYGVHQPIWGRMYEHTLHDATRGPVTLSLAGYCEPKIEPEIAFGMRAAPDANADAKSLLACIEWVAPAFEIVQSHFPGWKFQAADTVADGGLHGALVLGERVSIQDLGTDPAGALAHLEVALSRDGAPVETGVGSNVLGGPVQALAHLVELLRVQGEQALRAGEVVTTGTATAAYAVAPGQRWRATPRGAGLQSLEIVFE